VRGVRSQFVVISAAVTAGLLLAGCGGGDDDSGSSASDPPVSAEPTTTAAPAVIDLSQPIPGGSLHGTPRPPLENTGDDYIAIFESLTANFRWLTENPDPALLAEIYVPGTPGHDDRATFYADLVTNGYRWADEGYHLISVEVIDVQPGVVSLRVVDQLDEERLIDDSGQQVGEARPHGSPEEYMVLLALDDAGHWRIADATQPGSPEVEL